MLNLLAILILVLYNLGLIVLTCYMVVNHGWYWIFLLLLVNGEIKLDQSETNKNDQKREEIKGGDEDK